MIMTTEQKAKAYDEALEKARKLCAYPTTKPFISDLQDLFPELTENKDEKIRKALIFRFQGDGCLSSNEYRIDYKEIRAWLEKQGEQNPKFRVGDTIKCKYDDRQFTIKSVDLDKGTYTFTQEGCGNDIDYADEEFELVGQNTAWSEEDEKMYVRLNNLIFFAPCNSSRKELSNWLKSLKDRYTWKPSDEQIEALESATENCAYSEYQDCLRELIGQLKKLREE